MIRDRIPVQFVEPGGERAVLHLPVCYDGLAIRIYLGVDGKGAARGHLALSRPTLDLGRITPLAELSGAWSVTVRPLKTARGVMIAVLDADAQMLFTLLAATGPLERFLAATKRAVPVGDAECRHLDWDGGLKRLVAA